MFVLIYSDNELLSSDNEVKAFPTYDRAYHEMVRQFEEEAARDGYEIGVADPDGDVTDADGFFVGFITKDEAYLEDGEAKWVIFEVKEER